MIKIRIILKFKSIGKLSWILIWRLLIRIIRIIIRVFKWVWGLLLILVMRSLLRDMPSLKFLNNLGYLLKMVPQVNKNFLPLWSIGGVEQLQSFHKEFVEHVMLFQLWRLSQFLWQPKNKNYPYRFKKCYLVDVMQILWEVVREDFLLVPTTMSKLMESAEVLIINMMIWLDMQVL